MQNQSCLGIRRRRTTVAWSLLVVLVLLAQQQVSAAPVPSVDVQPSSVGGQVQGQIQGQVQGQPMKTLRRTARMTPLWRIMGTKPYWAHCNHHYECSTGICRNGHCVFSKPSKS